LAVVFGINGPMIEPRSSNAATGIASPSNSSAAANPGENFLVATNAKATP
jgi:hypothetical protein